jgi:hypothetical protein
MSFRLGLSLGLAASMSAVAAAPTVSAISPNLGDPAGGVAVTITGTGFSTATGATVGGVAITSFVVVNATTITGVTGAHAAGANLDVVVTNPGGTGTGSALFEYWSPASDVLQGWWDNSFSASPWAGLASAGGSSGRDLSEATNPPAAGTAVNTFAPASFDGVNDRLTSAAASSTFIGAASYGYFILCNATSVATDNATLPSNDALINSKDNGFWGCTLRSSGSVAAYQYDGSDFDGAATAFTIGQWQLVQAKYDGTTISIRVNGGSWVTQAQGNITNVTELLRMGTNATAAHLFTGKILTAGTATSNTAISFDKLLVWARGKYNLALT